MLLGSLKKIMILTATVVSFMVSLQAAEKGDEEILVLTPSSKTPLLEYLKSWSDSELNKVVKKVFIQEFGVPTQVYFELWGKVDSIGLPDDPSKFPGNLSEVPNIVSEYAGRNELICLDIHDQFDRMSEIIALNVSLHQNCEAESTLKRVKEVNLYIFK